MILMLTDTDGDQVLINSERISRASRLKYPPYATRIILRERVETHRRTEGLFVSHTEDTDGEEIAVSVQETVDEIFEMLNGHEP